MSLDSKRFLALCILLCLATLSSHGAGVDYSTIQTIYTSKCTGCHGPNGSGGLDLTSGQSYGNTVNIFSTAHSTDRVRPNFATSSWVFTVVVTQGNAANHNGAAPNSSPWSTSVTEKSNLTDWINQGALRDLSRPVVSSVSPANGGIAGGTNVTITGDNFGGRGTFVPSVSFGGTPATNVVVTSFKQITCTVPAHASGAVDVVVATTAGGASLPLSSGFTYTAPLAPPTVSNPTSSGVTTSSASLGGTVTSDGGSAVTERGVVYAVNSVNSNPQIGGTNVTIIVAGATSVFSANATALAPGTTYAFRAFATNSSGTGYTSPVSLFTTFSSVPSVSVPTATAITESGATLDGTVTNDGGAMVTARGFVYSATGTNNEPVIGGTGVTMVPVSGTTGPLTTTVGNLLAGTNYSFKTFATNSVGTTYSAPVSTFRTTPVVILTPSVSAPTVSSLSPNSATLGGNVTSDGGSVVTQRGVVYSETALNGDPQIGGPNVTTLVVSGTQGVFAANAADLRFGTNYSFRAFATNSSGTGYTSPVSSFTTYSVPPVVSRPTTTDVTENNATFDGNVTSDGGATVTARGFVYSATETNNEPLMGGAGVTMVSVSGTIGPLTATVGNLLAGTNYAFKAFATNSVGTTYSAPVSTFTTNRVITSAPSVSAPSVSSLSSNSATLGGNVTSEGDSAVTQRGVVYSETALNGDPRIGGPDVTVLVVNGTQGVFTANAIDLKFGTTYSFKAFATNSFGTGYTSPASKFTTYSIPPSVAQASATTITSNGAILDSNVTSDGGAMVTARGFVYSASGTNNDPKIGAIGVTTLPIAGATGAFTAPVGNLLAATEYSFKAFATNSVGTTYSAPVSTFTTNRVITSAPSVSAPSVSSLSSNSATLGGAVTNEGSSAVTFRGVVYAATSSNADPLIGGIGVTMLSAGGGGGVFTVDASNLVPGTSYSFKAFAINSVGTSYTSPVSTFTTPPFVPIPPSVNFPTSDGITFNTAILGGTVTSEGGAPITARGIVFAVAATNSDPAIGAAGVTSLPASGSLGVFTVNVADLTAGTLYSFKAFATNEFGTTYTPASSFATKTLVPTSPSISDPTFVNVTSTSATLGGNVTSDGGAPITARGIIYSVPSVNGDPLIGGVGVTRIPTSGTLGVFTVEVLGLPAETPYLFKAYAINSTGTTYTEATFFITLSPSPPPNDNFASAQSLTGSSGEIKSTTVNATEEVGEPEHANRGGASSVWFRWTAPTTGTATFETFNSDIDFDPVLAVYTGTSVDALTLVSSNDDFYQKESRVSFDAIEGMTYFIAADGYQSIMGTFGLRYYPGVVPARGTYFGLIESTAGAFSYAKSGFLRITVAEKGFTAILMYAGETVRFTGKFGGQVGLTGMLPIPKHGDVTLTLAGELDRIVGTLQEEKGAAASIIQAYRNVYDERENPAPQAGTYTLLTQPTPAFLGQTNIPQGLGSGKVTIKADGTATAIGKLGDGTGFTASSGVSKLGTLPLFVPLYKKLGLVQGTATFEVKENESDAHGTLNWFKPVLSSDRYYPDGFTTQVTYLLSTFVPPGHGERIIPLPNSMENLSITLTGGGIGPISPFNVTLDRNNRVTGNGDIGLRMTVSRKSGAFKGSFVDPSGSSRRKFSGSIFQRQGNGNGYFKGPDQTGAITLRANPAAKTSAMTSFGFSTRPNAR